MSDISDGKDECEKLLGRFRSRTHDSIPIAIKQAEEDIIIGKQLRM